MNKDEMLLSVIVPVYNAELTIKCCIKSILNQTYKNFEVVLVDDGSTDNSGMICDLYAQKDSRVTAVHIENSGPFQARKAGVQKTEGEILTFCDADDWIEKNAFETAMQIFYKYSPDMFAYTYDYGEGRGERHLYEEGLYCGSEIREEIIPGMMYDSAVGGRRLNPSLGCKLIKRELFIKATESVEDRVTLGEDALVAYPAVCMAERIYICNKVLYHYNTNSSSCTRTYPLERITEVRAFQNNITRLFEEMGMLEQMRYQIENYVRSFFSMMIKNWYGIELSPVVYVFPYNSILKGSDVLIYGAGIVGKSYVNELKITNYANIAGWADTNYEKIKVYNQIQIISPERIKEKVFDVLLISIWDEETACGIKENLISMGISKSKIVWVKPVHVIA